MRIAYASVKRKKVRGMNNTSEFPRSLVGKEGIVGKNREERHVRNAYWRRVELIKGNAWALTRRF